jgi:hypothetical protein
MDAVAGREELAALYRHWEMLLDGGGNPTQASAE